jgi:Flp pilus assembly pilin Flp
MSPSTLAHGRIRRIRRVVPTALTASTGLDRRATCARVRDRARRLLHDDRGMSTVEYAIGCVAAAAFAAVLYAVVSGDSVVTALTQIVQRALTTKF